MTTMNDVLRSEAERIRKKSDVGSATVSSPERQKIAELKKAYRAAVDGVRKEQGLSERGKQQLIARAYLNAKDEIAKLAKVDRDTHVKRYDEIEKKVFGTAASTPEAAMSFRDATTRAGALDSADAARAALGTAELSGDTTLARAIVMRAWQSGWSDVTEAYAIHNPTLTDSLAELGALRHHLDSTVSNLGGAMGASLSMPDELASLRYQDIATYAEADLPLTAADVFHGRGNGTITPQQESDFRQQAAADAKATE